MMDLEAGRNVGAIEFVDDPRDGLVVYRVIGDFTGDLSGRLLGRLEGELAAGATHWVVELGAVRFMAAEAAFALVSWKAWLESLGGRLDVVTSPAAGVLERLFDLLGMPRDWFLPAISAVPSYDVPGPEDPAG